MNHFQFYRGYVARVAATTLMALVTFAAHAADKTELLTAENFDKVENGMSAEQVHALLGKAPSGMGKKGDWTEVWHGKDRKEEIQVHYKDGVVDRKHSSFAWAKATKPEPAKPETPAKPERGVPSTGDEKFDAILKDLRSADEKKRQAAYKSMTRMKFDADKAPEVTKHILPHLRDKDSGVRFSAQVDMRKWVCPENADYFLTAMNHQIKSNSPNDPDRDLVQFAIEMLVKLKEPRAVEPLCKMMRHSFFERTSARDALIALGPELAQAEVLKLANDSDNNVRMAAREILDKFKTSSGEVLTQCLAGLKDAKPEKRYLAINSIYNLDVDPKRREEVATALQGLLDDNPGALSADLKKAQTGKGNSLGNLLGEQQKHPANAAVVALGKWGGPESEAALVAVLSSKVPDMRIGAANALAKVGTKKSLSALQAVNTAEKNNELGGATAAAIAAIQARGK